VKPFRPRAARVLSAIAATVVILIGAGVWMQMREPALDPETGAPEIYRGDRIETIAPNGDVAAAPNELRWSPVPNASLYRARILEVDRAVVWSGETNEPRAALPAHVVEQFAPGKRLLWEVTALRGHDVIASSDTREFRVTADTPRRSR
jgi:hypothetical protein